MNIFEEFGFKLFEYDTCNKMYTDWYRYEKCSPLPKLTELLNIEEEITSIEVFKVYYQNSCYAEYFIDLELVMQNGEKLNCRVYNELLVEKRKRNILDYITAGRIVSSDDEYGVIISVNIMQQKFEVDYLTRTVTYTFKDFLDDTDLLVFYAYLLTSEDILQGKMDITLLKSKVQVHHKLRDTKGFITFNIDGKRTILI